MASWCFRISYTHSVNRFVKILRTLFENSIQFLRHDWLFKYNTLHYQCNLKTHDRLQSTEKPQFRHGEVYSFAWITTFICSYTFTYDARRSVHGLSDVLLFDFAHDLRSNMTTAEIHFSSNALIHSEITSKRAQVQLR